MIQTKQDLKEYILADLNGKMYNCLSLWIKGNELFPIVSFIKSLRYCEYYNNKKHLSIFDRINKWYWYLRYRHNELKYSIYIEINTCGPGLNIIHPGYRKIHIGAQIGRNCTILPMVLIGKKRSNTICKTIIGNNVYIGTGATILGPVNIGSNVVIGAGAVVVKDIPDNTIVAGVPASVISYK